MNNVERDLRRRLKKSIRKRTELNNRILEYQKEKQELIEYLKEQINECKLTGNDEDYIKIDVYEEILRNHNNTFPPDIKLYR